MLKSKHLLILSFPALLSNAACTEILGFLPIDTAGPGKGCPSCSGSGPSSVATAGTNVSTSDFGTTPNSTSGLSSGEETSSTDTTGTPSHCADPNDPYAQFVRINASISEGGTWTCDKIYILENQIAVTGGILNIEAGTTIKGLNESALIVEKDAQLQAIGTPDKPIVFTSASTSAKRRGDWGGLVFLGRAKTNAASPQFAEGFSIPRTYGGMDENHNCGTLQYVRVEWAGFALTVDNELNAITFYACGTRTKVDHVQSHMGLDDGIEWFGGGFDAHHLIVTGAKDDGLDIDQGYRGTLQHIFIQQDPGASHSAVEISNNVDESAQPYTRPRIANLTLLGPGTSDLQRSGFSISRGGRFELYNSILVNNHPTVMHLRSQASATALLEGVSSINGSILNTVGEQGSLFIAPNDLDIDDQSVQQAFTSEARGNLFDQDPGLPSIEWGQPSIQPPAGGVATHSAVDLPAGFVATKYSGAVDPEATKDWTQAAWVSYALE